MRIEEEIKLDYSDVLFRPKRSTLKSRSEVDLKRKYKFKHSKLTWEGIPIIASNVLYVAVDNPIKVAVAGYSASQVSATTRNGTIKPVNKNNGEWTVNPTKMNNENTPIIDLYVVFFPFFKF